MLLDGDQLLLTNEAMPAAQRLCVLAAVRVILGHVLAHDTGSITGDIQACFETVLQTHTRRIFGADSIPCAAVFLAQLGDIGDVILVCGHDPTSG